MSSDNKSKKNDKIYPPSHKYFSNRIKQTLSVHFCLWTLIVSPFCFISILLLFGFYTILWPFASLYLIWFIYDHKNPRRGSRPSEFVKNWNIWRLMAEYFPVELHKTAEIPPTENYIFCAHPHGILGSSSMLLFSTNANNIQKLFPGINIYGATLDVNFWFPIRREFFMALGIISCNQESISYVLSRPEKGNAVGIVPGGAAESLESYPYVHRLILKNRKGFVRLAIKNGASLVPVYHFGETNLFQQISTKEFTLARKFQNFVKRWTSVAFPFIYGQNFIASFLPDNYIHKLPRFFTIGLLPFRHRVVTVVGAPIPVKKDDNPSEELVDAVHAEYCLKLREMFNEYKSTFGGLSKDDELQFL
ncbi:hypothetical protein Mgra_00008917 [Meloidogyne graminicola]|uniref:Acyltransferase n=1 Tax=Meloidogyne graminicola TaxID=189291 RepID=A0A8S9ZEE1_9BILA|nr:hypothetical protein Mgra_00008917 [Meloidogyne graminicola]